MTRSPSPKKTVLPEDSDSTGLSTPQKMNSEPMLVVPLQVTGAGDQSEQAPLSHLPPIIYSRTVHAPVTVSAGEFARVLAGVAEVALVEISVVEPCSGSALHPQKQAKTQHDDVESAKQVNIKRKGKRCC